MKIFNNIDIKKWFKKRIVDCAFLFQNRTPLYQIAQDDETKEEIYKFRYQVYIEELGREPEDVDHVLKRVKDELDDFPYTLQYYQKKNGKIIATLRAVVFPPGYMKQDFKDHYHLNNYPWLDDYNVCEVNYALVSKKLRSKLFFAQFLLSIFRVLTNNVEFILASCKPYLLKHYLLLGCNFYTENLMQWHDGIQIPMMWISSQKYARKINSPFRLLTGSKNAIDPYHIEEVEQSKAPIILNSDEIYRTIKAVQNASPALNLLNESVIKSLVDYGCYIISVEKPIKIIHNQMKDGTMYLILSGETNVHFPNASIKIGAGNLIGEFSYFEPLQGQGKHMVDVECQYGHLLIIKPSALKSLAKYYHEVYIKFLHFVINNTIDKSLLLSDNQKI